MREDEFPLSEEFGFVCSRRHQREHRIRSYEVRGQVVVSQSRVQQSRLYLFGCDKRETFDSSRWLLFIFANYGSDSDEDEDGKKIVSLDVIPDKKHLANRLRTKIKNRNRF